MRHLSVVLQSEPGLLSIRIERKDYRHQNRKFFKHMVLEKDPETSTSRELSGSDHRKVCLSPAFGAYPTCMTSLKCRKPVTYRTTKFPSNRHRKLQPFRET